VPFVVTTYATLPIEEITSVAGAQLPTKLLSPLCSCSFKMRDYNLPNKRIFTALFFIETDY
jgi:hypothetical protein